MATSKEYRKYADDARKRAYALEDKTRNMGTLYIGSNEAAASHEKIKNLQDAEAQDLHERARRNENAAMGAERLTTEHSKYKNK